MQATYTTIPILPDLIMQYFRFNEPGSAGEKLLDVPIGQVGPEDTIVITVDMYLYI